MVWVVRPAHPRVGGENDNTSPHPGHRRGSSPRGRGKLIRRDTSEGQGGLIPAWAGKTLTQTHNIPIPKAHPRVGGENVDAITRAIPTPGSSPRGRGKLIEECFGWYQARLIPAWAGKTPSNQVVDAHAAAHPRVGGENLLSQLPLIGGGGSSPRGRGKRTPFARSRSRSGLIPAWAGKTAVPSHDMAPVMAHPRVGGENSNRAFMTSSGWGSSPRGRGKLKLRVCRPLATRLIPAWAGKTRTRRGSSRTGRAHPRVGGENGTLCPQFSRFDGSSPRGRGKPQCSSARLSAWRLIPAWAGKTTRGSVQGREGWAHPRVGGENPGW